MNPLRPQALAFFHPFTSMLQYPNPTISEVDAAYLIIMHHDMKVAVKLQLLR